MLEVNERLADLAEDPTQDVCNYSLVLRLGKRGNRACCLPKTRASTVAAPETSLLAVGFQLETNPEQVIKTESGGDDPHERNEKRRQLQANR